MAERVPQSVAYTWVFRAYLASDGKTPATGKTIAITISKNGGAFGNPNAGALNATEISSGFYKAALDTTDTGTAGPLALRGAQADINDVGETLYVQAPPKVDVDTIKTQTVTCAAGVTVLASVGTATTSTAQSGDVYPLANSGTHGFAALKTLIDTVDDFLDTEIAAILAAVDTEVAAIKAKTDSLTFTVANVVDANIQRINDVTVNGDGSATPWGP